MNKEFIKTSLPILVTLLLFAFLMKKVPLDQMYLAIKDANLWIICLVPLISIVNGFVISSFRWKLMLNQMDCKISFYEAFFIKAASDPIISALPLKTGEISRILYLRNIKKFPVEKSLFSIFLEYFLNMCGVSFFILMGLSLESFQIGIGAGTRAKIPIFFLTVEMLKTFLDHPWITKFKHNIKQCFDNKKIYLNYPVISLTLIFCFLEIFCVFLLTKALGIYIPLFKLFVYVPMIIVISSIPISIFGLGVREGLILVFFLNNAPPETLLALGILYSFCEHIIPAVAGLCLTSLFVRKIMKKNNCNATTLSRVS